MKVLQNMQQVAKAREELNAKGLPAPDVGLRLSLRRLGVLRSIGVGEMEKSWDVLETLDFIDRHLSREDPIVDIGAFASEVIVSLHRLGYRNLAGVDLSKRLGEMPYADSIRFETCDFMQTPFEDGSFAAVTAISVIEHGFDPERLLREVSRVLRPGGYFIASFDYWPEKIDTTGTTFFGMDWLIFSEQDVRDFIAAAARHGLYPSEAGEFGAGDRVIHCGGKDYTFAWLALQKEGGPSTRDAAER